MDMTALSSTIDRFNQHNDPFAIGMNFVVAGISSLQEFIKHVEAGTLDAKKHTPLLDTAEQMIVFGGEHMAKSTKDRSLLTFVERYRGLCVELKRHVRA